VGISFQLKNKTKDVLNMSGLCLAMVSIMLSSQVLLVQIVSAIGVIVFLILAVLILFGQEK